MKAICTAFAVFVASVTWASAQTRQTFCESSSFSLAPAEVQFSISNFGFSADKENTQAHLVLRNESNQPVTRVLILAESLDEKGQHISTLPFYAATKQELDRAGSFFAIGGSVINNPLLPQEELPLGITVSQSTARCPAKIRPVLIDVDFWNGTKFHYGLPTWQLESSVGSAKPLQLSDFPGSLPSQELVDVSVDLQRRISKVHVHSSDPQVARWFQKQLASWSIFPEVRNGERVPSEVKLLFRFHKVFDKQDPTPFDNTPFQNDSVIAVDVFPKGNLSEDNQFIFAGGLPIVAPR